MKVARHLNGPPGMVQGGYVAGLVARELGTPGAEVRLRAPTPLEEELALRTTPEGEVQLVHGDDLCATGSPAAVDVTVPQLTTHADARAATRMNDAMRDAFAAIGNANSCFGCGLRDDGLHLHAGPVLDGAALACSVEMPDEWFDGDEALPEIVWIVLDCPSLWACYLLNDDAPPASLITGTLATEIRRLPRRDDTELFVQSWVAGRDGRKFFGEAALVSGDEVLAVVRQTAIALSPPQ